MTYAARLADMGASALELNLYDVATLSVESGADVESRQIELVAAVVSNVQIPVAVKLTPFHASLPAFVHRLEQVGVRGVTVFNRLYEPTVDLDALEVRRTLTPSTPADLRCDCMRWPCSRPRPSCRWPVPVVCTQVKTRLAQSCAGLMWCRSPHR